MRELFATILDNAWVVSIMILVIVLIRTFMKKMPKFIYPLLWGLVAVNYYFPMIFIVHLECFQAIRQ